MNPVQMPAIIANKQIQHSDILNDKSPNKVSGSVQDFERNLVDQTEHPLDIT